jgi:hypothetical protein
MSNHRVGAPADRASVASDCASCGALVSGRTVTSIAAAFAVVAAIGVAAAGATSWTDGRLPRHALVRTYPAKRIEVRTHKPYEQLLQDFHAAVGQVDLPKFFELVARGASWQEVVAASRSMEGPSGFMWFDVTPMCLLFSLHDTGIRRCQVYTVGDPILAETMVSRDTSVSIYLPTKITLYEDRAGRGRIVYVLPSSQIGQLGSGFLARQSREVDRKLQALVDSLARD